MCSLVCLDRAVLCVCESIHGLACAPPLRAPPCPAAVLALPLCWHIAFAHVRMLSAAGRVWGGEQQPGADGFGQDGYFANNFNDFGCLLGWVWGIMMPLIFIPVAYSLTWLGDREANSMLYYDQEVCHPPFL